MKTALDTNVPSKLWNNEPDAAQAARLLADVSRAGSLIICPAVYAELLADRALSPDRIDGSLAAMGIVVEFELSEAVWKEAGMRYRLYAARRLRSGGGESKRLLTDFLVGAHALLNANQLLTFDTARYRSSFPELTLVRTGQL